MTIYPKVLYNYTLNEVYSLSDFRTLSLTIWSDYNSDTGLNISEEYFQMTCHKDAISVTSTNDYVELCVNGTKVKSLNNEYYVLDGTTLVPINCATVGLFWANSI